MKFFSTGNTVPWSGVSGWEYGSQDFETRRTFTAAHAARNAGAGLRLKN